MEAAGELEQRVGMRLYRGDLPGTGGHLRETPETFLVREIEQFDVALAALDADRGSYPELVFRATLRGWDTNGFASALSDRLGISRERVSWAGTKDKRAISTQLFSVRDVAAEALPEIARAELEPLGRAGRPVLFGDLAGNSFEITVTDPDRPGQATAVADSLRVDAPGEPADRTRVGVPNYFGQQRFGSLRAISHLTGLAILRKDWETAVLTYVAEPSEHEPAETRAARRFIGESRQWAAGLERLPRGLGYERAMVQRLAEAEEATPAVFRAALETLPSNLQQLMVNAAQSYIFNLILSARLEAGLPFARPVAGDVVCFADRDAPDSIAVPEPDRTERATEGRLETIARHCQRRRAFVTAPLVGTGTTFATGEPGELTRSVLEEVGVVRADFELPGEFGSTGTRRAIQLETAVAIDRDPLCFDFALPSGSYATVLLREFLKSHPSGLT
jgi:tRNA pseudouridine13 synthase